WQVLHEHLAASGPILLVARIARTEGDGELVVDLVVALTKGCRRPFGLCVTQYLWVVVVTPRCCSGRRRHAEEIVDTQQLRHAEWRLVVLVEGAGDVVERSVGLGGKADLLLPGAPDVGAVRIEYGQRTDDAGVVRRQAGFLVAIAVDPGD